MLKNVVFWDDAVWPSIIVSLMMEAISSSETSVLTTAAWHHIPEGGILHSHRRENQIFPL
jgi:hypothetical protein